LAPDSKLFQSASIPLNPLKAGKRPYLSYLCLQRCASMRHVYISAFNDVAARSVYLSISPTMHQHAPGHIYASKYAPRPFLAAFSFVSTVHVSVFVGAAIEYNLTVTSERPA
jgi:hypothetical protein